MHLQDNLEKEEQKKLKNEKNKREKWGNNEWEFKMEEFGEHNSLQCLLPSYKAVKRPEAKIDIKKCFSTARKCYNLIFQPHNFVPVNMFYSSEHHSKK